MVTGAYSPSAVVPITRRAGACVAGVLVSPLLDWSAPDGPAASFPSAGVGAAAAPSCPSAQGSRAVKSEPTVVRQGASTGGSAAQEGNRDARSVGRKLVF